MRRLLVLIFGFLLLVVTFALTAQAATNAGRPATPPSTGICVGRSVSGDRDVTVQWTDGQPSPYTIYADEGLSPNLDMVGMLVCSDGRYVNWIWGAADNAPTFDISHPQSRK